MTTFALISCALCTREKRANYDFNLLNTHMMRMQSINSVQSQRRGYIRQYRHSPTDTDHVTTDLPDPLLHGDGDPGVCSDHRVLPWTWVTEYK